MGAKSQSRSASAGGRGRPAAPVWSVAEVADVLRVPDGWVERALERAPDVFLPGSFRDAEGRWLVPERSVRGLLGPGLPRLFSVADFAALVGFSVPWIYEMIQAGAIECRTVLGHKRIPETAYWALPAHRPEGVAARPLIFSEGKTA
jgi:hypothetical protein